MEIEDIYICKSKVSIYIFVYFSILIIINIVVWDKVEFGVFFSKLVLFNIELFMNVWNEY